MKHEELVIVNKCQHKNFRIRLTKASVIKVIDAEYKINMFNIFKEIKENITKEWVYKNIAKL